MDTKDFITLPRLGSSVQTMFQNGRFYAKEFGPTAEDLPTTGDWYHVFDCMSQDPDYATQIAIKMTGNATPYPEMFYRFKSGTWKMWMCVRSTYDGICHTGGNFMMNGSYIGAMHTGISDKAKVRMFVDGEGATIELTALNGKIYHMDTLGNQLRFYTFDSNNVYHDLFTTSGDVMDITGGANSAVHDSAGNVIKDTYLKRIHIDTFYGGSTSCYMIHSHYGPLAVCDNHGTVVRGVLIDTSYICPYDSNMTSAPPMSIGSSSKPWSNVYSSTALSVVSDKRQKENIQELESDVIRQLIMKIIPVTYRLIINESGRTHYGMISQQVEEVLTELGIDTKDFGGFIKSPVTEDIMEQATDENGELLFGEDEEPIMIKTGEKETGEYTYMLRYEEFLPILWKYAQDETEHVSLLEEKVVELTERNTVLENRVSQLEKLVNEFIARE